MQQHVRDHLRDFVAITPRRQAGLYANRVSGLWHQPLYVDEKDGILKRTDRLPEEKARRRVRRTDDGLGFSLVPWQPVLEKRLERHVSGIAMPDGGIDWTFERSRGLSL